MKLFFGHQDYEFKQVAQATGPLPTKSSEPPLPDVQPLDILLYFTPCFVDLVIAIKTYCMIGHVEMVWTPGKSVAARAAGVKVYDFRRTGLKRILRHRSPINFPLAQTWFEANADGKKYNWAGLLAFDWPGDNQLPLWKKYENDRWFCSELGCDLLRAAGCRPFADGWPSIKVPPALFVTSPNLDLIWSSDPNQKYSAPVVANPASGPVTSTA
ncbi:MAG TPA: hypothetical protein VMQ67_00625 [Candidatus Saccharimonadales bacterium]|nr:hypothetical protein [Candidatus Saccharimonadales bacterium]